MAQPTLNQFFDEYGVNLTANDYLTFAQLNIDIRTGMGSDFLNADKSLQLKTWDFILAALANYISHLSQGDLEWDANKNYVKGAIVRDSNGEPVASVVPTGPGSSNATDPKLSGQAIWVPLKAQAIAAATTLVSGIMRFATDQEAESGIAGVALSPQNAKNLYVRISDGGINPDAWWTSTGPVSNSDSNITWTETTDAPSYAAAVNLEDSTSLSPALTYSEAAVTGLFRLVCEVRNSANDALVATIPLDFEQSGTPDQTVNLLGTDRLRFKRMVKGAYVGWDFDRSGAAWTNSYELSIRAITQAQFYAGDLLLSGVSQPAAPVGPSWFVARAAIAAVTNVFQEDGTTAVTSLSDGDLLYARQTKWILYSNLKSGVVIQQGAGLAIVNNQGTYTIALSQAVLDTLSEVFRQVVSDKTGDYSIVRSDRGATLRLTANASHTFTLPDAPTKGDTYTALNSGSGTLTLAGNGSDTINNNANTTLAQYEAVTVQATTSSTWAIIWSERAGAGGAGFTIVTADPNTGSTDQVILNTTANAWKRWNGSSWTTIGGGSGGGGTPLTEVTEQTNLTPNQTWTDISTDTYQDDDYLSIQVIEGGGDFASLTVGPVRFGDIPTTNYIADGSTDGAPMSFVAQVTGLPNESANPSYKTLITDGANDQYLSIDLRETAGEYRGTNWVGRFQDLTTSQTDAVWCVIDSGGLRFQVWRDGSEVRANYASTVNAANQGTVVRAGKLQQLRVRRSGSKLRYRLHGEIDSTNTLRVLKYGGAAGSGGTTYTGTNGIEVDNTADTIGLTQAARDVLYGKVRLHTAAATLTATDLGITQVWTASTAGTLTLPSTAVGTRIDFYNDGSANLTVEGPGTHTVAGHPNLAVRPNTGIQLQKITATAWVPRGGGASQGGGGGSVIAVHANQVGGTGNSITLAPDPAIPTLYEGLTLRYISKASNTGAATVSVSSGSPVNVKQNSDGDAVPVGYLAQYYVIDLVYDGTQFVATSSVKTEPGIPWIDHQYVSGSSDAILIDPVPAFTSLYPGLQFQFVPKQDNTTAVTINASGLGTRKLYADANNTELKAGQLPGYTVCTVVYDGSNFLLSSIGGVSTDFRTLAAARSINNTFSAQSTGLREFTLAKDISEYDFLGVLIESSTTPTFTAGNEFVMVDASLIDAEALYTTGDYNANKSKAIVVAGAQYQFAFFKVAVNKIRIGLTNGSANGYATIYGYHGRGGGSGSGGGGGGGGTGGGGYTLVPASELGGTANAITITPSSALVAYSDGLGYTLPVQDTNTGPVTIKVSSLNAVKLLDTDGTTELGAGRLRDGEFIDIVYAGTNFVLMGRSGLVEAQDVGESIVKAADTASADTLHSMQENAYNTLPQQSIDGDTLYFLV